MRKSRFHANKKSRCRSTLVGRSIGRRVSLGLGLPFRPAGNTRCTPRGTRISAVPKSPSKRRRPPAWRLRSALSAQAQRTVPPGAKRAPEMRKLRARSANASSRAVRPRPQPRNTHHFDCLRVVASEVLRKVLRCLPLRFQLQPGRWAASLCCNGA